MLKKRWLGMLVIALLWAQSIVAAPILVVGDSISAAFGMDTEQGWVALLEQRLSEQGHDYEVINASISGDTTSGGLTRLPRLLEQHRPALVILELGGNDGLRGQNPAHIQQNLEAMIEMSQAQGAQVLLLGMQIPPNYGRRYTDAFAAIYPALSAAKQVPLVGFLLEGVAGVDGLMQRDGIHPAKAAQNRLLDNVWDELKPLL